MNTTVLATSKLTTTKFGYFWPLLLYICQFYTVANHWIRTTGFWYQK